MLNNLHFSELNKKNISYLLSSLEFELGALENSKKLDKKLNLINKYIILNKGSFLSKLLAYSSLDIKSLSQIQLYKVIYDQNSKPTQYLPIFELKNLAKSLQIVCNNVPEYSNINICLYSNNKSFPISIFKSKNITVKIYYENKNLTFTLFENNINPLIFHKLSLFSSNLGLFTYENIKPNTNKSLLNLRKSNIYNPINFSCNFYFIKKYVIKKIDIYSDLKTIFNETKIIKSKNKKFYKGYKYKSPLIKNSLYDLNNKRPHVLYNFVFDNLVFKKLKIKYSFKNENFTTKAIDEKKYYKTTKSHYYLNSTFKNLFTISKQYPYTYNSFLKLDNVASYKTDLSLNLINKLKNIDQNDYNKFYKVIATNFIEEISFKRTNKMKKLVHITTLNNFYSSKKKYPLENIFDKNNNKKEYLPRPMICSELEILPNKRLLNKTENVDILDYEEILPNKRLLNKTENVDILDYEETLPNKRFLNKTENVDILDYEEKKFIIYNAYNYKSKLNEVGNINEVGIETESKKVAVQAGAILDYEEELYFTGIEAKYSEIEDDPIKFSKFIIDNIFTYNKPKKNIKKTGGEIDVTDVKEVTVQADKLNNEEWVVVSPINNIKLENMKEVGVQTEITNYYIQDMLNKYEEIREEANNIVYKIDKELVVMNKEIDSQIEKVRMEFLENAGLKDIILNQENFKKKLNNITTENINLQEQAQKLKKDLSIQFQQLEYYFKDIPKPLEFFDEEEYNFIIKTLKEGTGKKNKDNILRMIVKEVIEIVEKTKEISAKLLENTQEQENIRKQIKNQETIESNLINQVELLEKVTDPLFAVQVEKYKELQSLKINVNNFKNISQLEEKLNKSIKYDDELIDKVAKVRQLSSNFNMLNKDAITIKHELIDIGPSQFISPYSNIKATYKKPFDYFIKSRENELKSNSYFYFDKKLFDEIERDSVNNCSLDIYSNKMCLYELKRKAWVDMQAFFYELYDLDLNVEIIKKLHNEVNDLFDKFEIKKIIGFIQNYTYENIDLFNEVEELREKIIEKLELFSENFEKTTRMFEKKEFGVQTKNTRLEEIENLSKTILEGADKEELTLTIQKFSEPNVEFQEIDPELQLEFPEKDRELISLEEDLGPFSSPEILSPEEDSDLLSNQVLKLLPQGDKLDDEEKLPNKRFLNKTENVDILDYEEKLPNKRFLNKTENVDILDYKEKLFSMEKTYIYSKDKKNINLEKYLSFKKRIGKKISCLIEVCNKNINEQLKLLKAEALDDIKMCYENNLNKYNDEIFNYKNQIEKNKNIIANYNKKIEELSDKFEKCWEKFVRQYYNKDSREILMKLEIIYPKIKDCFSNFKFDNFDKIVNEIEITEPILSIFEEVKIYAKQLLGVNNTNFEIGTKIIEVNQLIEDLKAQYISSCDPIYSMNYHNYRDFFKEDKKITINSDLHFILSISKLEFDNDLIKKLKNISTRDIENNLKNRIIELIDDLNEFNLIETDLEKVKNKKPTIDLDYTWKDYFNKVMLLEHRGNDIIYKDSILENKILEVIKENYNDEIITNKLFVVTQEHILRKYIFENTQDFILAFYNKLLNEDDKETCKNVLQILNKKFLSLDYNKNKLEILNELKLYLIEITTSFINTNDTESLKCFLFNLTKNFPDFDLYSIYDDFENACDRVKNLERKINYIFEPQTDYILNYDPLQKKIITKKYNYFGRFNNKLTDVNKKSQIPETQSKINEIKELSLPESNKFEQKMQTIKSIDNEKPDDKPSVILNDIDSYNPIKSDSKLLKTPEKKKIKNYHKPLENGSKENVESESSYFQSFKNQFYTPQKKPNQQIAHLEKEIKNIQPRTPLTRIGGFINMR